MEVIPKRRKGNDLLRVIATALIIQIDWLGVILSPRWARYGAWTSHYRAGVFLAIAAGVIATATYLRWAFMFHRTNEASRKEKTYSRSRDFAWAGMMLFMVTQLLL